MTIPYPDILLLPPSLAPVTNDSHTVAWFLIALPIQPLKYTRLAHLPEPLLEAGPGPAGHEASFLQLTPEAHPAFKTKHYIEKYLLKKYYVSSY